MKLTDKIKGWMTKGAQRYSSDFADLYLSRVGGIQTYNDRDRMYVQKGYQDNPIVNSITTMVAKHGSKAGWTIKDKEGNVVKNTLLDSLMANPNTGASWGDFIQDYITQYVLTGNGFAKCDLGTRMNAGKPMNIYIIPSEETQILISNDGKGIRGYRVDFLSGDREIPASEVLHVKTPNPDYDEVGNWLYGQSPFRAARVSIQTYNKSMETGIWFLENKGAQKILFNKDKEKHLSDEVIDKLKQRFRKIGQGSKNAANLPILSGEFGVLDVSATASEALVLEQRLQAAKEICNVMNFPIQLLGLDTATYQNAKEAKKLLWENVIIPILCEIKAGLNRWLTPQFGKDIYLDFDLSDIDALQEDKLMRFKAIKESAGMITINEARIAAGAKPYAWMKEPTNIEEFREQVYVGFTQAVISDSEDVASQNNEGEPPEPKKPIDG